MKISSASWRLFLQVKKADKCNFGRRWPNDISTYILVQKRQSAKIWISIAQSFTPSERILRTQIRTRPCIESGKSPKNLPRGSKFGMYKFMSAVRNSKNLFRVQRRAPRKQNRSFSATALTGRISRMILQTKAHSLDCVNQLSNSLSVDSRNASSYFPNWTTKHRQAFACVFNNPLTLKATSLNLPTSTQFDSNWSKIVMDANEPQADLDGTNDISSQHLWRQSIDRCPVRESRRKNRNPAIASRQNPCFI